MVVTSVSVIVPVHDNEAYVGETIASIAAQTLPPTEIIVVDDGSTDRSIEIVRSVGSQVRVVHADVGHPERARAVGLGHASNEVIAFCDADDVWLPGKLEQQTTALQSLDIEQPLVVWAGVHEFVSPEIGPGEYQGRPPLAEFSARLTSSLLTTRRTFESAELDLGDCGSWIEWVTSLPDDVQAVFVEEVLVRRRLHLANHSASSGGIRQREAWLRAARRSAERRR